MLTDGDLNQCCLEAQQVNHYTIIQNILQTNLDYYFSHYNIRNTEMNELILKYYNI